MRSPLDLGESHEGSQRHSVQENEVDVVVWVVLFVYKPWKNSLRLNLSQVSFSAFVFWAYRWNELFLWNVQTKKIWHISGMHDLSLENWIINQTKPSKRCKTALFDGQQKSWAYLRGLRRKLYPDRRQIYDTDDHHTKVCCDGLNIWFQQPRWEALGARLGARTKIWSTFDNLCVY